MNNRNILTYAKCMQGTFLLVKCFICISTHKWYMCMYCMKHKSCVEC